MSQLLQQVIDRGEVIDDWLSPLRAHALEALSNAKSVSSTHLTLPTTHPV